MTTPILATKLYAPIPRRKIVLRPRLIERLKSGLSKKMTLVSAPAGFGKTTLVSEWAVDCGRPSAWLSLDAADNDASRFLCYLITALQKIKPSIGQAVLGLLDSPQPPPVEQMLTALVNEINTLNEDCILVFDDYHLIDSKPVDDALAFLLDFLPPQLHLIITTREDPNLPLARFRARDQMIELRAADLSFDMPEATEFLNRVMELNLSTQDIAALETRTEGWIAGLQLAAISMRGQTDPAVFIKSFSGSHHFVLDYLVEEVIKQQAEHIQNFLLRTSILDRMCGSLCDSLIEDSPAGGQEILEYLEQANLFIIPLDNERRWYRYHHLFADLLRQRLLQNSSGQISTGAADAQQGLAACLHVKASQWYEDNGWEIEAFQHAAAANDIERAERLIEGNGTPLHFRGAISPVLHWLTSLPVTTLDARPSLWITFGSATMVSGHPSQVEPKLLAAEAALKNNVEDEKKRDLIGQIAALRALVAAARNDTEKIITQANRALEYLNPNNVSLRNIAAFSLGIVYELQNDRAAASRAYTEIMSTSRASGNFMFTLAAMSSLANLRIIENQLPQALEIYQQMQVVVNDPLNWLMYDPYFGMARIYYEWNDLDATEKYVELCLKLAPQVECGTVISSNVLLALLQLARGNPAGAAAILANAREMACQPNYASYLPEVIEAQIDTLLYQGDLESADRLAREFNLPASMVRVNLARGEATTALAQLETLQQQVDAEGRPDKRLKQMVLQAVAHFERGDTEKAMGLLENALAMAEPGGYMRTFLDEGHAMSQLLSVANAAGIMPAYTTKLLDAFHGTEQTVKSNASQPLIEPLSQREMEVLRLIAQGLSNREISERLYLALSTVKGHSRIIFDKLQVQRRTEAVARARELGLI